MNAIDNEPTHRWRLAIAATLNGADSLNGGDDLIIALDGDDYTDTIDDGAGSAATGEEDADQVLSDEGDTVANATVIDRLPRGVFFAGLRILGGHHHGR